MSRSHLPSDLPSRAIAGVCITTVDTGTIGLTVVGVIEAGSARQSPASPPIAEAVGPLQAHRTTVCAAEPRCYRGGMQKRARRPHGIASRKISISVSQE